MPWSWRYEKADGSAIDGLGLGDETWTTQADAESWVGENWRAWSRPASTRSASSRTAAVYGPMSLHPPEG